MSEASAPPKPPVAASAPSATAPPSATAATKAPSSNTEATTSTATANNNAAPQPPGYPYPYYYPYPFPPPPYYYPTAPGAPAPEKLPLPGNPPSSAETPAQTTAVPAPYGYFPYPPPPPPPPVATSPAPSAQKAAATTTSASTNTTSGAPVAADKPTAVTTPATSTTASKPAAVTSTDNAVVDTAGNASSASSNAAPEEETTTSMDTNPNKKPKLSNNKYDPLKFMSRCEREVYVQKKETKQFMNERDALIWKKSADQSVKQKVIHYEKDQTVTKSIAPQEPWKQSACRSTQVFHIEDSGHSHMIGYLDVPPGSATREESSGNAVLTFMVQRGEDGFIEASYAYPDKANAIYAEKTAQRYYLGAGDMFYVPQFTRYRIKNYSTNHDCKMHWTLSGKIFNNKYSNRGEATVDADVIVKEDNGNSGPSETEYGGDYTDNNSDDKP